MEDVKSSCPNCGYCPHCGRSNGYWTVPSVPYIPWYPTYPYPLYSTPWLGTTWTDGETGTTFKINTTSSGSNDITYT